MTTPTLDLGLPQYAGNPQMVLDALYAHGLTDARDGMLRAALVCAGFPYAEFHEKVLAVHGLRRFQAETGDVF